MVKKLSCMCGASLAEYVDTGNRDEKFLANISLRENISCISKIELPYNSAYNYAIVCIDC